MHILVTGGAGYIGSVTAAALLQRGHRVTVIDDLRTGHLAAVPAGARTVIGALADPSALRDALHDGADACVHFAAASLVGESMERPHDYFADNLATTVTLLRALHQHGVGGFVLSSTAAVYGTPAEVPIREDARVQPESVYGASKAQIEALLPWLARTADLGWTALRYFNAAGATDSHGEDHRPETHLIPLVLQVAAGRRERIQVFGDDYPTADGSAVRDYVHVADLAEAHCLAVEALRPGHGAAYNLGTGRGHSVLEVVDACRRVTGHQIPTAVAPRREGDPPRLVADPSRIATDLGWRARHQELDDIVASAWRWMQARPHGYGSDA